MGPGFESQRLHSSFLRFSQLFPWRNALLALLALGRFRPTEGGRLPSSTSVHALSSTFLPSVNNVGLPFSLMHPRPRSKNCRLRHFGSSSRFRAVLGKGLPRIFGLGSPYVLLQILFVASGENIKSACLCVMFDEIPNHRWMFGVGGDYEGFRYATEQEGIDLILAIGWTGSPALVSNVESVHAFDANNEAKDIMDLIGRTRIVSSRQSSTFLTSTAVDDDLRVLRVTDRHSSGEDSVDSEATRPKGRDLPFLG